MWSKSWPNIRSIRVMVVLESAAESGLVALALVALALVQALEPLGNHCCSGTLSPHHCHRGDQSHSQGNCHKRMHRPTYSSNTSHQMQVDQETALALALAWVLEWVLGLALGLVLGLVLVGNQRPHHTA